MQTTNRPTLAEIVRAAREAGFDDPREIGRVVRHVKHGRTIEYAIWAEITQGGTLDTHIFGTKPPVRG